MSMLSNNKKLIYSAIVFMFLIVAVLGWMLFYAKTDHALTVTFLNVGQGDAILISQDGYQVLIDGGANGQLLLERLSRVVPFWDRTIEVVVATHPDEDHIGGLLEVLAWYNVESVITSDAQNDTQLYERWYRAIKDEEVVEAYKGLRVVFPSEAVLETLFPFGPLEELEYEDLNDTSVTMRLTYGENTFLFTGDLSSAKEDQLPVGDIDILKAGHHGSKHSTSALFLERARPEHIIISAGANNRYGHPAQEVVERIQESGAIMYETAKQGSIQYVCPSVTEECRLRFW